MNKTVIVTGGATGIGEAIVRHFSQNSYNVVFTYNNSANKAKSLEKELNSQNLSVKMFKCDVRNSSEIKNLLKFAVSNFNKIDTVISNAGISSQKLITDISDEEFIDMLMTHAGGTFFLFREASRLMVNQKSGNMIAISSYFGEIGGSMETHYSMAKGGIITFVKALAKELGPSNIRVNSISPGVIDTRMLSGLSDSDKIALADEAPLMRLGTPLDIAKAALFLSSDNSSFITGHNLSVSGGINIV